MKKIVKALLCLVLCLAVVAAAYVVYVWAAYYRLEDQLSLAVEGQAAQTVETGRRYRVMSYNVGFGAYSADYSFFMDGGTESRARSEAAVRENLGGAMEAAESLGADFCLFQEVDTDATRSFHVDEKALIQERFMGRAGVFAQNYDSPYLFWPLTEPHGKSRAGLLTLSDCAISQSVRRQLPIEAGVWKLLDLDRCYSVTRLPVEGGKELVLINAHLSAYTKSGSVAREQLAMLGAELQAEYEKGNYVICGGDFNMDLLGNSAAVFGVSGEEYSWAKPFPEESLPAGISLMAPFDAAAPVPSCRNADRAYVPGESFTLTVDGFLVSDNVTVEASGVVDTGFAWSDHNPVWMDVTFGA